METNFLIKVNNFGNANIESLKKDIYNSHSLFHMHELNSSVLEGECKTMGIGSLREFTFNNACDLTLIYYNLAVEKIAKIELKYGNVTSKKIAFFSEEMESELLSTRNNDYFFDLFVDLINASEEISQFPQVNSFVRLNSLCDDIDVLDYSNQIGDNTFKVESIDYESGLLFAKNCPYGINFNHVTVLGV